MDSNERFGLDVSDIKEYERTHETVWGWCNYPPDEADKPQFKFFVSWNKPREWYRPYFQVTIWKWSVQFGFLF